MDVIKDSWWLIIVIILIWFAWFFTGGPDRREATEGPFLKPPQPLDTGEVYGELPGAKNKEEKDSGVRSLFADEISIFVSNGVRESNPNKEYIELRASFSNNKPVRISGWELRNSKGVSGIIGDGSKLPLTGGANTKIPLLLNPGESAFVTTGRSPIGVSFQINSCSGYLEQFQDFSPRLQKSCPTPISDLYKSVANVTNECSSYVSTLPSCEIVTAYPQNLPTDCQAYIANNINYNSCVNTHKNDIGFYKREWRLFLGENNEMWGNSGDLVRLYDNQGNLVDSRSY